MRHENDMGGRMTSMDNLQNIEHETASSITSIVYLLDNFTFWNADLGKDQCVSYILYNLRRQILELLIVSTQSSEKTKLNTYKHKESI